MHTELQVMGARNVELARQVTVRRSMAVPELRSGRASQPVFSWNS